MSLYAGVATLAVHLCVTVLSAKEYVTLETTEDPLAVSLQKKLVNDNYDYFEINGTIHLRTDSNENTETQRETKPQNSGTTDIHDDYQITTVDVNSQIDEDDNSGVWYEADTESHNGPPDNKEQLFDTDKHLAKAKPDYEKDGTTSVKYKLIKSKHKSRRKFSESLIQEEKDGALVIMKLGGGPMPQFRLPQSRRQYMHDHNHELSDLDRELGAEKHDDSRAVTDLVDVEGNAHVPAFTDSSATSRIMLVGKNYV
ncbi:unnamed protein product [Leptidea sinapis]|uniref:Uncharacterized protein n=1 Tax=Leptidea sinapis TaxID=189913 RepID=A0A5E4R3B6_9NEOP|nr:unnamed protein product [Leptidea sinapis]